MALSRRKKIIIGVSALTLLVMIIGFSVMASRKDTPEVTTVKVETRRELKSTVTASGEVRPIQYINLTSEVAGRIVDIYVKEGDSVTVGQEVCVLEAMKMKNSIRANRAGKIAAVRVSTGDQVRKGQALLEFSD